MSNIRFIHAADLHIESPYKGLSQSNEELGKALVSFAEHAYDDLIDKCIQEKVDFLLIAGDSFDSEEASLKAQYSFVEGLRKLEKHKIEVYVICGNHDPLSKWPNSFKIPSNVHLFNSTTVERKVFEKEGKQFAIYGCSFMEKEEYRNLAKTYYRSANDDFAIGILHGTLEGAQGHDPYAPFSMDDLRASGIDYWALGHIHKRAVLNEAKPTAIYVGNLQGRHFNESGEKGCYLVEVAGNQIEKYEFLPISKVLFDRQTIDISNLNLLDELIDKIEDHRNELLQTGNSYLLRLQLEGQTELYADLQDESEIKQLFGVLNAQNNYKNNFVFLDKIINETNPIVDFKEREQSNDFIGSLLSNFSEYIEDDDKVISLSKLIYEEISGKKAGDFIRDTEVNFEDPELMKRLMEVAKRNCVGGLILEEKKQ